MGWRLKPVCVVIALSAAAILAGCAADTVTPDGVSVEVSRGGSAPAAITTGSKAETAAGFNPFADTHAAATGGREVIEKPTLEEVMQPGRLTEIAVGRADAPVTIIKYMSLTCPFCRQFQATTYPQLKRELIDTGKVRYVLREFPIGMQSGAATIALRCAPPERQLALYEKFLAQQAQWVSQEVRREPIFKVAAQVGVTRAQFDACFENQSLIAALKEIKERGRTLGVIGTPNFFVNGELIKSVLTIEQIRQLVAQKVAAR
jgi:protein-disulfide isomerase